jgi:hypothetical protein
MTVVLGDGMMVKKPKGSAENAPKAAVNEKPVTTGKKRGGKKEK